MATPRYLVPLALTLCLATYGLLFGDLELIERFAGREQLVEILGALFLLAASLTCLATFRRRSRDSLARPGRSRLAFLLLGLLFFVAFGEEVSWGQHLLGFRPPEIFERHNIQRELNLHNLRLLDTFTGDREKKTGLGFLLNSNRLFDYFMFSLFLAAPLLAAHSSGARARLEGLGVPLLPVAFAVLLMANLVATLGAELFLVRQRYPVHLAVSEIREFNYALLCFLAAVQWLGAETRRSSSPRAAP